MHENGECLETGEAYSNEHNERGKPQREMARGQMEKGEREGEVGASKNRGKRLRETHTEKGGIIITVGNKRTFVKLEEAPQKVGN